MSSLSVSDHLFNKYLKGVPVQEIGFILVVIQLMVQIPVSRNVNCRTMQVEEGV